MKRLKLSKIPEIKLKSYVDTGAKVEKNTVQLEGKNVIYNKAQLQ